jgi:signal transduction histidine kinase
MNMQSALSYGFFLALMLGLTLTILVPLSGWLLLAGARAPGARIWYGGLFCYALASLMYVLQAAVPVPWLSLLPGTLAQLCLLLLSVSLYQEVHPGRRVWHCLWLPPLYLLAQTLLLELGLRAYQGVLLQHSVLALLLVWLLWNAWQLWRRETSRGLMFIITGTAIWVALTLLRIAVVVSTGEDPGLLKLQLVSSLFFVISVLCPIFWSLGYWGFMLERTVRRNAAAEVLAAANQERMTMMAAHNRKLEETVRERDQMVVLNSRFASVQTLSLFNAGIVHELSQPLQSLSMCQSELVQRLAEARIQDPEVGRLLQDAQRLTRETLGTLRSLRSLMSSSNAELEAVDVREVLTEVLEVMRSELQLHRIALAFEDRLPPHDHLSVLVNRVLLQRVLLNVLGNARQELQTGNATERGAMMSVWLSQREAPHGQTTQMVIGVQDNGRGLSEQQLAQLGQLLPTGKSEGLGVGLALVKIIMEHWGGALHVQSPPPGQSQGTLVELLFQCVPGEWTPTAVTPDDPHRHPG